MTTIAETVQAEAKAAKEAPRPLMFRRVGEAMVPLYRNQLDRFYTDGKTYALVEYQHRSDKTHNHEFAFLNEAWKNLPEQYADQFATPEHLRKRLLIDTGWYDETVIDVGTNAGALRVAREWRHRDEFAYIVVRGGLVVIREAKSQARGKMNRQDFQKSKQDLIDAASGIIGVTPETLNANAGQSA